MQDNGEHPVPQWTLVSSHGLVLLYVAEHDSATIAEIARSIDMSPRRVADLLHDLAASGLLLVRREGRRNRYAVDPEARFRHPYMAGVPLEALLAPLHRLNEIDHAGGVHVSEPPRLVGG